MEIFVDLHIHSKYSRATSFNMDLNNLEKYAKIKGVNVLGTGDFQHPKWFQELNKLEEDENGILWTKTKFPFIWQTEISLMYTQDKKGRRIHFVLLAPNKEIVKQMIDVLGKKGRLDYDGRPIFNFSAIELVDMIQLISNEIEIIPAHCMTPWYAIFGSKSGFDSVEECFKEKSNAIHALETGMSANPSMLRKISKFDKFNLVSFSDSHSYWPWRLAREATIFDCNLSFKNILKAIRTGDGLKRTIETVPAYGRYHFDGHRECNILFEPKETKKHKGICPKCHRPLTIGVEYRIEQLADRDTPKLDKEFKDLIPLHELISAVYEIKQLNSKRVWSIYDGLIKKFGNEFDVLLKVNEEELRRVVSEKLSKVIIKNREGKLSIHPGFDGKYGELILTSDEKEAKQRSLKDF